MAEFKCLNCGYCCIIPAITIVHPDYINSKIVVDKTLDYLDKLTAKSPNTPCPHLRFDKDGKSSCLVHDKEWYISSICMGFKPMSPIAKWFPKEIIEATYECIIGLYVKKNFPPDWWKDWWNWIPAHTEGHPLMDQL